jgi:hypothetical protein
MCKRRTWQYDDYGWLNRPRHSSRNSTYGPTMNNIADSEYYCHGSSIFGLIWRFDSPISIVSHFDLRIPNSTVYLEAFWFVWQFDFRLRMEVRFPYFNSEPFRLTDSGQYYLLNLFDLRIPNGRSICGFRILLSICCFRTLLSTRPMYDVWIRKLFNT